MNHRVFWSVLVLAVACGSSAGEGSADGVLASRASQEGLSLTNDTLKRAADAIDAGHPWLATVALAPIVRDAGRNTPTATLLAARAAAGWDGWTEVERFLKGQPWLDTSFDGEGHELLARAAFARGADSLALPEAQAALTRAKDAHVRAQRLVYVARALDRGSSSDSAAAVYAIAATSLPSIDDWLYLRAAGAVKDSAGRAALFKKVSQPAARARVTWTEAQARERFADLAGAAARYAALGATVQALRLRLAAAADSAARDAVKRELLAFLAGKHGTADTKLAVEVLDRGFPSLSANDELTVARGVAVSGPAPRALSAFARAPASSLTDADRLQYGTLLSRSGRTADARAQFNLVRGALAGQAAYQAARLAGAAALRDVANRYPTDTAAATAALYLLADLAVDAGDDARARTTYRELYDRYPKSTRSGDARFAAAIIALAGGDATSAARELDSVSVATPSSGEAVAARYWAGRAWTAAGNRTNAEARWRQVVADEPRSYYGSAAAHRLGDAPWAPSSRNESLPHVAAVDSAIARIALLDRLGMDAEARFELDALEESAASSHDRRLATAAAFRDNGQAPRAMRIARALIDAGEQDVRAYRLLYPLPDREQLVATARARSLDPAVVAGIIRQESSFNPHAVSVAGARGLMQVMPPVGQEIARALRYPVWSPALLFDADANLEIGTAHLADAIRQYGALPRVLSAYNAGASRLNRWAKRPGTADAELFIERIPFVETRDYARIVSRNIDMYRALYGAELSANGR